MQQIQIITSSSKFPAPPQGFTTTLVGLALVLAALAGVCMLQKASFF
jgi:hypothetical protein